MGGFRYHPDITTRFPDIRGGVIHIAGVSNGPTPEALRADYLQEQVDVLSQIGETPLSEIPSLAAWRSAFSAFGVKPTQYRNAAESLLRRLTKKGDIPSINALVDMANLISIRHRMPVAVFDQGEVTGRTTVRFADGTEQFTDLGSDTVSHPDEGEVVFVDDASLVSARRWCWRQSAQSAAGPETTEAVVTIEGQHAGADADVKRAVEDFVHVLTQHQPGSAIEWTILSPAAPSFEPENR